MTDTPQLISFLVGPDVDPVEAQEYVKSLRHAPLDAIEDILRSLIQHLESIVDQHPAVIDDVMRLLQSNILRQSAEEAARLDVDLVVAIYENLPQSVTTRFLLLHALAVASQSEHLQALFQQLSQDPPANWIQTGLVVSPLFQRDDWPIDDVFPEALEALEHTAVAGAVIDLANHVTRKQRTDMHPGCERLDQLIILFSALISQLEKVETNPRDFGDSPEAIGQILGEAIGLIVSLCDAFALIEDDKVKPHLRNAMDLSHRRIQTEAAGALAAFGDEEGTQRLVALADEPSARLRVLTYAEELGIGDQVPDQYKTPMSRAESELALWLAQPGQMSVPPSNLHLVDERSQFWPGFDDPIQSFLFRFDYPFGDRAYSNIGIVGPMVHAFAADLTTLDVNDMYAAFAGWQAEHDDIYEVAREHWNPAQQRAVSDFEIQLEKDGFESIRPEFLGFFLGEHALIAGCSKDGTEGAGVTDGLETIWFPSGNVAQPMTNLDAWNIYKGRKILRTFNA